MIVLVLICTLIGYLCGSAVSGLIVGLLIAFTPMALDEWDKAAVRRMRARGRR